MFDTKLLVMVLVQDNVTHPITVTGLDLRTTYRLWFSADANNPEVINEAAPLATIDPSSVAASTSDGLWKIWFGVLYLSGGGRLVEEQGMASVVVPLARGWTFFSGTAQCDLLVPWYS